MTDRADDTHAAIVRALAGVPSTDETYRQIGRFIQEFSLLEYTLRRGLASWLEIPGDLFDHAMAPYDVSTLCNVISAIGKKKFVLEEAKLLDSLLNQVRSLNDDRVRVAHGTWFDGIAGMSARHTSRQKLNTGYYFLQPTELATLANRASAARQRVNETLFPS